MKKFLSAIANSSNYIFLAVSAAAIMGSLYYSEVEGIRPCVFCWYQRILMYPIFPMALVAIATKDNKFAKYVAPLAVLGSFVAFYHYLLQKTTIFGEHGACTDAIPCGAENINYFGFVTIPFLSLMAFLFILFISLATLYFHKKSN